MAESKNFALKIAAKPLQIEILTANKNSLSSYLAVPSPPPAT